MTHEFRSPTNDFAEIFSGVRSYDIRELSEPIAAGDTVRLRECDPTTGDFTGREAFLSVVHVTRLAESNVFVFGFTLQATTLRPPSGGWPRVRP